MSDKLQPGKISGELSAFGLRFGIVVSRFNGFITDRLLSAATDALGRAGAASKDVDVVPVPERLNCLWRRKRWLARAATMR
jgi:6,7-dimethyl-8-ribityllumazine synthase